MSYEKMWNLLRRTVNNDYDIFCNESSRFEFHRGVFDEVQTIIRRMDELEEWTNEHETKTRK